MSNAESFGVGVPDEVSDPSGGVVYLACKVEVGTEQAAGHEQRQMLAALGTALLADLLVYRGGGGYTGWGVLTALVAVLWMLAIGGWIRTWVVGLTAGLLSLAVMRLVWQGNGVVVCFAGGLLTLWAWQQHGQRSQVDRWFVFLLTLLPFGASAIPRIFFSALGWTSQLARFRWLAYLMPMVISGLFAMLFLFANPDAWAWVGSRLQHLLTAWIDWLEELEVGELLFLLFTFIASTGALLKPRWNSQSVAIEAERAIIARDTNWFVPVRNTLMAVNVVFCFYLLIEYTSFWWRDFPAGFHYSGYAHQGAAWLTLVLLLATVVLGGCLQGPLLADPRFDRLRRLALIWSVQNFVLAVAVLYRLSIYVDYNGMSRMRIVGYYGVVCVVVGFALVLKKVLDQRCWGWLIRQQVHALLIALFLLAVTPMDLIAHTFNARRVLQGRAASSVQVAYQWMTPEGWWAVVPLMKSDDDIIREGVTALLAEQWVQLQLAEGGQEDGWQKWQGSRAVLAEVLEDHLPALQPYIDDGALRSRKIEEFTEYAYQWY